MILELKKMALLSLSRFTNLTLSTSLASDNNALKQFFTRAISAIPDSSGHLNFDCKSQETRIVSDSGMQCQLAETSKKLCLSSKEKNTEKIANYPETPISEFQTEGSTLSEPNATFNKSFLNLKGIVDEKSLLAAFCSKLSNIWDNSEQAKRRGLPSPIAAPKRGNYFVSNSMFPNEVWSVRIENKALDIYDERDPCPRCFGYNLPTLSEKISQSVKQTPCKINAIEPNFIFGEDSDDSGLDSFDSNEKGIVASTETVFELSDCEFKEEFPTEDENCMEFESLEDYTKVMKTVVEDICCMAKRLEDSTIVSTMKDHKVYVEPETQTLKNDLEDDSMHELLEEEYEEMDYLFLELPTNLNFRPAEDSHVETSFNILEFDQHRYGTEMCVLNCEKPTFNLLPVPCSIWCDQNMEAHAHARYSHDMCEKLNLRRSKSLFEEHIEEMHSKYPDLISKNFQTEDDSTDLPPFLWLKDESNTAYATVIPDIEPCKKSQHSIAGEGTLNYMQSFFNSLYLPKEDLLLSLDMKFSGQKFKSDCFGKDITGNNDDCSDSSSRRGSSGYFSDAGTADGETEFQSCVENIAQDKNFEDLYDGINCNWTPLPDLPSSDQCADSRSSRGKRYTKAPKRYSNTKFGLHNQQCQNFALSYRQPAMVN